MPLSIIIIPSVAVIGFINAPYQADELSGSVLIQVGATELQRQVTVMLSIWEMSK